MIKWIRNRALLKAVERGNLTRVRNLVAKGADVNTDCSAGEYLGPPLRRAIACGHLPVVQFLLDHGATMNVQKLGCNKTVALHWAARSGHLPIVEFLVGQGADPNAKTGGWNGSCNDETTALHEAIDNQHLEIVKYLLTHGADANTKVNYGRSPLEKAVLCGNVAVASILLAHGAKANTEDDLHGTPLSTAAVRGDLHLVKLLVQHGARDLDRALDAAISGDQADVIGFLAAQGANINSKDSDDISILHKAVANGKVAAVQALVTHGADVDAKNRLGRSSLDYAISFDVPPRPVIRYCPACSQEAARQMIPILASRSRHRSRFDTKQKS